MHTETRRRLDAWFATADALLAEEAAGLAGPVPDGPTPLGKLWVRLAKERDLELHVRTGWRFRTEYVQLLDYVPSTGTYENEVLIEARLLPDLADRFSSLVRYRGRR
ncbi:MAG: hypothetical protein ACRDZ7_11210 [Acidimicrobiia bacterium]